MVRHVPHIEAGELDATPEFWLPFQSAPAKGNEVHGLAGRWHPQPEDGHHGSTESRRPGRPATRDRVAPYGRGCGQPGDRAQSPGAVRAPPALRRGAVRAGRVRHQRRQPCVRQDDEDPEDVRDQIRARRDPHSLSAILRARRPGPVRRRGRAGAAHRVGSAAARPPGLTAQCASTAQRPLRCAVVRPFRTPGDRRGTRRDVHSSRPAAARRTLDSVQDERARAQPLSSPPRADSPGGARGRGGRGPRRLGFSPGRKFRRAELGRPWLRCHRAGHVQDERARVASRSFG